MTNLIDRPTGPAAPLPPPRPLGQAPKRTPAMGRVLWMALIGLMIVATLAWGSYQVVNLLVHEERVEEESWPAAGVQRLVVESANGSVRIVGSEGDTVDVRAEISDGLRRTGESRELVGNTLQLQSTCPKFGSHVCRVDYEVRVPAGVSIVVDIENGSVELADLSGSIDASSENGRVEGARLSSLTVTADSDNGRVALEFVEAPLRVVATSDNGTVEVVVPDDGAAYRLDLHSDNGGETAEVPTDPTSERTLTVRSDNGSVTARTTTS